jgi:hypothetical protein
MHDVQPAGPSTAAAIGPTPPPPPQVEAGQATAVQATAQEKSTLAQPMSNYWDADVEMEHEDSVEHRTDEPPTGTTGSSTDAAAAAAATLVMAPHPAIHVTAPPPPPPQSQQAELQGARALFVVHFVGSLRCRVAHNRKRWIHARLSPGGVEGWRAYPHAHPSGATSWQGRSILPIRGECAITVLAISGTI